MTHDLYSLLTSFLFPEDGKSGAPATPLPPLTPIVKDQAWPEEVKGSRHRRNMSRESLPVEGSTSSGGHQRRPSTAESTGSSEGRGVSDVVEKAVMDMKARARDNMTFHHILVSQFVIDVSYKGPDESNFSDIEGLRLELSPLCGIPFSC